MKKEYRRRIFEIIQIGNKEDFPSRAFDVFIVINILTNITLMFLETFDSMNRFYNIFKITESFTIIVFCIEYILRIWTADFLYPQYGKIKSRLRYIISYDGIIDILTILPFFFLSGFIAFRMLRVVRIFHLFRINAQYDSFHVITTVLYEKKNQIISSVFIILILMLASSLGMYNVENEAQPDVFKNAFSGIWWSVSTLLTVGYGDIYPVTYIGKIMAICIAFLGVGVVAIPTGIISAGFVEQYTKNEHSEEKFPDIDEIGEILVSSQSTFLNKTVKEINEEYDIKILVIIRENMTIIAGENIEVKLNDVLVVNSDKIVKNR